MRAWSIFFGTVTVIIVATMALPDLFGFVRVAQWGGMYTDGWCQGTMRVTTGDGSGESQEHGFTAGNDPATRTVWYAPQFTAEHCEEWVMSQCGTTWMFGKTVVEAYAMFRHVWLKDRRNLCDEAFSPGRSPSTSPGSSRWFPAL